MQPRDVLALTCAYWCACCSNGSSREWPSRTMPFAHMMVWDNDGDGSKCALDDALLVEECRSATAASAGFAPPCLPGVRRAAATTEDAKLVPSCLPVNRRLLMRGASANLATAWPAGEVHGRRDRMMGTQR